MSRPTPEITLEQFAAAQQDGTTLDVRERAARLHVICASGGRSSAMTDLLVAQGFDAVSVAGGTQAWTASGRAVGVGLR